MVKKYIINDLYCIIYSIDNIITDGFIYSIPNKKKISNFHSTNEYDILPTE